MAGRIDARLKELGIELPEPATPKVAKILNYKQSGNLLFISGQVPRVDGEISFIGKVGREYTLEEGQEAARVSAICVLGAARAALGGDLDRIEEIVRVKGYINVDPDFTDVSAALNGASELFIDIFGEPGKHSRTAIGVASMPFGVAIEVEAVLQVR
ncbi:MAG: RidA family protein [Rhodospirillaceae bacterium]|jgi:enamine deaminase RidA (YjgF/YER057c/UK114 family)|nr:RidA family protein [Rhodospirillaceae bacterium]